MIRILTRLMTILFGSLIDGLGFLLLVLVNPL